jgi:hypothetical protein
MKTGWYTEKGEAVVGVAVALVLAALVLCALAGCSTRQAQVATQTALNTTAAGIEQANKALVEEEPRLSKEAAVRVWRDCPAPCSDFETRYDTEYEPVTKAIKGVKIARDACFVAQGTQDAWVATGSLPDTGPLCKGLADTVGPVPALLSDAGVKNIPSEVEALAGPGTQIVCDVVSGWVKNRR